MLNRAFDRHSRCVPYVQGASLSDRLQLGSPRSHINMLNRSKCSTARRTGLATRACADTSWPTARGSSRTPEPRDHRSARRPEKTCAPDQPCPSMVGDAPRRPPRPPRRRPRLPWRDHRRRRHRHHGHIAEQSRRKCVDERRGVVRRRRIDRHPHDRDGIVDRRVHGRRRWRLPGHGRSRGARVSVRLRLPGVRLALLVRDVLDLGPRVRRCSTTRRRVRAPWVLLRRAEGLCDQLLVHRVRGMRAGGRGDVSGHMHDRARVPTGLTARHVGPREPGAQRRQHPRGCGGAVTDGARG